MHLRKDSPRRSTSHRLLALVSLLTLTTVETNANDQATRASQLNEKLEQVASEGALTGFTVAIVTTEGPRLQRAWGHADLELRKPYTTRTIQPVASLSKTVVGVSLMLAVADGRAELDAPLDFVAGIRIQSPRHPDCGITLRGRRKSGFPYRKGCTFEYREVRSSGCQIPKRIADIPVI